MIRSLLYIVKVGVLVGAAVWLANRPGSVRVDWMDYTLNIQFGFFLIILALVILLGIFIYNAIKAVTGLPRSYRRYRDINNKEKGHRALALGLTAVAAGDARKASQQAARAVRLLPDDLGMPLLLKAQAEKLKGNEAAAREIFVRMLDNKDTAFLGVRGLLQDALDAKNYPKALALAQRGLQLYPKQKWILQVVYDLELRARNWDAARIALDRATKADAIDPDRALSDNVAMLMYEADVMQRAGMKEEGLKKLRQAHKLDPYFVPAALALARRYKYDGKKRKGMKLIERTWEKVPHAALAKAWPEFMPAAKEGEPFAKLKWAEKLLDVHPDSADAHIVAAEAAIDVALWGEARDHLEKAESVVLDVRVCHLRAEVEKRAFQDNSEAMMWMKKAQSAPPSRAWVCRETGRVYDEWRAVAEPHGSFNTMEWEFPHVHNVSVLSHDADSGAAASAAMLRGPLFKFKKQAAA
jgi:HemY protein